MLLWTLLVFVEIVLPLFYFRDIWFTEMRYGLFLIFTEDNVLFRTPLTGPQPMYLLVFQSLFQYKCVKVT